MFGGLDDRNLAEPPAVRGFLQTGSIQTSNRAKSTVLDGGTETDNLWCNFWITDERLGTETVVTPMGTFVNCMKFRLVISVRYTPRISGRDGYVFGQGKHGGSERIPAR